MLFQQYTLYCVYIIIATLITLYTMSCLIDCVSVNNNNNITLFIRRCHDQAEHVQSMHFVDEWQYLHVACGHAFVSKYRILLLLLSLSHPKIDSIIIVSGVQEVEYAMHVALSEILIISL